MGITEHETFEMKNVLSFRAKMTQKEIGVYGKQIETVLQTTESLRVDIPVTATFSVEQRNDGEQVMDMEFLIPIDRNLDGVELPEGFCFKEKFYLTNAVKLHHVGHPAKLQESIIELNNFIAEHKLTPITVGYNVTVKEPKTPLEMDLAEVDVYVGISPNKL